jgi:hypothetical protein
MYVHIDYGDLSINGVTIEVALAAALTFTTSEREALRHDTLLKFAVRFIACLPCQESTSRNITWELAATLQSILFPPSTPPSNQTSRPLLGAQLQLAFLWFVLSVLFWLTGDSPQSACIRHRSESSAAVSIPRPAIRARHTLHARK